MSSVNYSCPQCGALDIQRPKIVGGGARCPVCSWTGPMEDTVVFATTEKVYDANRVGEILIRVMSKYAAGPLIQALEALGLSPKEADSDVTGWNTLIAELRQDVLRSVLAATIEASFTAGVEAHAKAKEFLVRRYPKEAAKLYPEQKP